MQAVGWRSVLLFTDMCSHSFCVCSGVSKATLIESHAVVGSFTAGALCHIACGCIALAAVGLVMASCESDLVKQARQLVANSRQHQD